MSEPYAIARYLSDADKQRILAHRFVHRGEETGDIDPDGLPVIYHGLVPVSADDQYCPLAYVEGIDEAPSAPDASTVARAIARGLDDYPHDNLHYTDVRLHRGCDCLDRYIDAIFDAAAVFISDWDAGTITDLAAALGVERRAS